MDKLIVMNGLVDEWIDGWIDDDGLMDQWMDDWIVMNGRHCCRQSESMNGCTNRCSGRWTTVKIWNFFAFRTAIISASSHWPALSASETPAVVLVVGELPLNCFFDHQIVIYSQMKVSGVYMNRWHCWKSVTKRLSYSFYLINLLVIQVISVQFDLVNLLEVASSVRTISILQMVISH